MMKNEHGNFNDADKAGFKNAAGLLDLSLKDLAPALREKMRSDSMNDFRRLCNGIGIKFLNAAVDQEEIVIGDVALKTQDCTRIMHMNDVMYKPAILPAIIALRELERKGKLHVETGVSAHSPASQAFPKQYQPDAFVSRNQSGADYHGYKSFFEPTNVLTGYALQPVQKAFLTRHAKDKKLKVLGVVIPANGVLFMQGAANHPQLFYKPEIEPLIEQIGVLSQQQKAAAKKSPAYYIAGGDEDSPPPRRSR